MKLCNVSCNRVKHLARTRLLGEMTLSSLPFASCASISRRTACPSLLKAVHKGTRVSPGRLGLDMKFSAAVVVGRRKRESWCGGWGWRLPRPESLITGSTGALSCAPPSPSQSDGGLERHPTQPKNGGHHTILQAPNAPSSSIFF